MRAFGLRDSDLDRRMSAGAVTRFVLRAATRAVVLVPFAVVGVCGFAPPYWLTSAFSRAAPDLQSRATWKVIDGIVIYAAWMGTLATAAGMWAWLGAGLVTGLGLPLLAFAGLAAFDVRPRPSNSCGRFSPAGKLRCARAPA